MRFQTIGKRAGLLAAALLVFAAPASAEELKIGVVDIDQALAATDDGKAARDEFERKVRAGEAQLKPMADQLQAMFKEVEQKQFVLSEDAIRQKRLEVAELQNKIENRKREVEGQLQVDRERLLGPILEKLESSITELGRTGGFSMILRRGTPGVLYTREALDITDQVVQAYDNKE
jgi:outer membrane protein